jgi:hypothetical protein
VNGPSIAIAAEHLLPLAAAAVVVALALALLELLLLLLLPQPAAISAVSAVATKYRRPFIVWLLLWSLLLVW